MLGNGMPQSFTLSSKCDHPFFSVNSPLHFQSYPNSLKSLKIGMFEVSLPSYFVRWWEYSFSMACDIGEEEQIYFWNTSFQEKMFII